MPNRAEILKQKLLNSMGLPWQELLPASAIEKVLADEKVSYRQRVYTPVVTLWMFLSQVLDADKSLQNAVNRAIAWLTVTGGAVPSSDTGAYSKARNRLPESLLQRLILEGVVAVQQERNPTKLQRRLLSFLTPAERPRNQKSFEQIRRRYRALRREPHEAPPPLPLPDA